MGAFCANRTLSCDCIVPQTTNKQNEQHMLDIYSDIQLTTTKTRWRNNALDLSLLSAIMERVVNTFETEGKTSEQLYYETYHGEKNDSLRLPVENDHFRKRATSVGILKNSIDSNVKPFYIKK